MRTGQHCHNERITLKAKRTIIFNTVAHAMNPQQCQLEEILEGSEYYRTNMASLRRSNPPKDVARRIIPSIQMAALRIAGVRKTDAMAMVNASASSIDQNVD
jgi:hypothetical protein